MLYRIFIEETKLDIATLSALSEYEKRLSPYTNIKLITSKEHKRQQSDNPNTYKILINKHNDTISSEEFANKLAYLTNHGHSTIDFYIGTEVSDFNEDISISHMNISNGLLTNILYEQIYRGYMINIGKTYNK